MRQGQKYDVRGSYDLIPVKFLADKVKLVPAYCKLWDVKFAGFRLIIPYIDNKILRENFLQKSVVLFKDIAIDVM